MNKTYTNQLTPQIQSDIQQLIQSCRQEEPLGGCMFWEPEWNIYPDFPCYHLLYTENGELLGVLAAFLPNDSICELYAYVHPLYRCQGHFKNLLHGMYASFAEHNFRPSLVSLVCENTSSCLGVLQHMGIEAYTSELLLRYMAACPVREFPEFSLNGTSECLSLFRQGSDIALGHCHMDYEDNTTTLYNIEIFPEYRGQGYSGILMHLVLKYLEEQNAPTPILLHVTESNLPAVRTYQNCGFEVVQEVRYYTLPDTLMQ